MSPVQGRNSARVERDNQLAQDATQRARAQVLALLRSLTVYALGPPATHPETFYSRHGRRRSRALGATEPEPAAPWIALPVYR